MNEKTLFRIALMSSMIGIFGLIIISYFYEYNLTTIQDIDDGYIDKKIVIEGEISNIKSGKGVYSFEIYDETGKIKAIAFSELNVINGQEVKLTGQVTEYNNELEIKIERLENL